MDANQLPTPFITSVDLRTREEVSEEMRNHMEIAHMLQIKLAEAEAKKIEMELRKIEMEARKIEAETAAGIAEREPPEPTSDNILQQPSSSYVELLLTKEMQFQDQKFNKMLQNLSGDFSPHSGRFMFSGPT